MTELVLLILLLAGLAAWAGPRIRGALERRGEDADRLAAVRRMAEEDVTRFGEELQELHVDTLTDALDAGSRQDYQQALDSYEHAKQLLLRVQRADDLQGVTAALEDGRYADACVRARLAGEELPQRRPPCFFDPGHGVAQVDIAWSPPGGVSRLVPACAADAERVRLGAAPAIRKVTVGTRLVPWYDGGPAFAPYARGYYQPYVTDGIFAGFLLGSIMGGGWGLEPGAGWSGDGGLDGGPGGFDGGSGGFDGGGFDGGGF